VAKVWIVTYPGLGSSGLKLHEETCRYLQPSKNKPDTGKRRATPAELRAHQRCKVC
jgi:hypothetical protein